MTRFLFNNTIEISALTEREANNIFKVKYPGVKIENSKVIRNELYTANNIPTIDKINIYDANNNTYYRFQNSFLEMGNKSWEMGYDSEEEALENDAIILNGKSCCSTAKSLHGFRFEFNKDYHVLVLTGDFIEIGHDDEDVIDVAKILEIWSYEEFCKMVSDIKMGLYDDEE